MSHHICHWNKIKNTILNAIFSQWFWYCLWLQKQNSFNVCRNWYYHNKIPHVNTRNISTIWTMAGQHHFIKKHITFYPTCDLKSYTIFYLFFQFCLSPRLLINNFKQNKFYVENGVAYWYWQAVLHQSLFPKWNYSQMFSHYKSIIMPKLWTNITFSLHWLVD